MAEVRSGGEMVAMHFRAAHCGQRLNAPGQWKGLPTGDGGLRREALAFQVAWAKVERRSLVVYEAVAIG